MNAFINLVTLCAPGMDGWEKSKGILSGDETLQIEEVPRYKPGSLPRNEQRRASDTVRLAFRIGEEIAGGLRGGLGDCASVFASSGGDHQIIHQICQTLCSEDKLISPTQFHNSVHNAPSGYWSIATGSHESSVSLSAFDDSFMAGLLESMSIIIAERKKVLFIAYDVRSPSPLGKVRKVSHPFAVGMLLSPDKTGHSQYHLKLEMSKVETVEKSSLPANTQLEQLYWCNPIARCIPVLEVIARGTSGKLVYLLDRANSPLPIYLELKPC